MSDFLSTGTLPDHYEQLAKTVRDFASSVVAPVSAKHDAEHSFPYEVVAGMADMGLFGLPFPEEYGGMGGDYFALCLALEELGKVDQSVAITLEAGVSLGAMPVYRFGNDAQKQEWLPLLASGKALGAFGLTEAGGGTDAGATKTTAKLDDGHWVINGSKQFITNSGTDITKLVTVTAVTGETDGTKQISSILVPVPTAGFTAEPAYDKVGWNASDTHPLSFDDVRVPQENLLGERGRGYANFLRILDEGRIAIAALSVGVAQGCVDECVKYAKEREAFGAAIGTYQAIAFKIARMEARAHVARTAYYDAAALMLAGKPFKKAAVDRQAGRQRGRDGQRPRRHPGVRRLRLHERVPGRAALPRQQDPRNRRGHNGSAADADRPGGRPVSREAGRSSSAGCGSRSSSPACSTSTGPGAPSPRPTTSCSPR